MPFFVFICGFVAAYCYCMEWEKNEKERQDNRNWIKKNYKMTITANQNSIK